VLLEVKSMMSDGCRRYIRVRGSEMGIQVGKETCTSLIRHSPFCGAILARCWGKLCQRTGTHCIWRY
jgi:hypothetical protein